MKHIFTLALALISIASFGQNPLWMRYPAISPDGSKIAFNYKGDLYVVDSKGGDAKQLTTHQAHDFMAVWSADGSELAFASNRYGNFDVYVMPSVGGKARRLTYNSAGDFPYSFDKDGAVLFGAARLDDAKNTQFPSSRMPELYKVNKQGDLTQVLTTPSEDARWNKAGTKLVYHDKKGYEDVWRKHHTSSVTRDVWIYDAATKEHAQITTFNGEDRTPIWSADEKSIYYLSEQAGSFNVWKKPASAGGAATQITKHEKHPVRFLTMDNIGVMCYGFDGEIYTMKEGGTPSKIAITVTNDDNYRDLVQLDVNGSVSEVEISPKGDQIVFVSRGEVFVTAIDYSVTKRLTNTPGQERNVSFSPDGRSVLFAGERGESWNIYEISLTRKEEKYFYNATILKETELVATAAEAFQPAYSPDGKEVAYLSERVQIEIYNKASKEVRVLLPAKFNYSYSDGDQSFEWSPDSKWILATYMPYDRWNQDIALLSVDGKKTVNLTESGYECYAPKWIMGGEAVMWFSGRNGMRAHGSWGHKADAYAMFLSENAYDKFKMTKAEFSEFKDADKKKEKEKEKEKKSDDKKKDKSEKKTVKPIKFDLTHPKDRVERLTIHSSSLADGVMTKDGSKLYYLSSFEKGFDLWEHDFKKHSTKLLSKLKSGAGSIVLDDEEEQIYLLSSRKIVKIDLEDGSTKPVSYKAKMNFDQAGEFAYIYEHAWRQTLKKFYKKDMHGVDWKFYKDAYAKFLPYINNGHDFAEILSELLGELNASHTGARFYGRPANGDRTATLGIFIDYSYTGEGVKIAEVMDKGPFVKSGSKMKAGMIIKSMNGEPVKNLSSYFAMLNHKSGERLLIAAEDGKGGTIEEYVKPISGGAQDDLIYDRWVKGRRAEVKRLSNGQLGYVHVRGMDDESFRQVYNDALGKHCDDKALIVDTRFNGGGWLHDDLATFLSGKDYATFLPRGQKIGHEPLEKWYKPTIVLAGEGNYSDAHGFPFAYRALNIGKVVGMPIPGTMTAVWWERQINRNIVFGIPQVGMMGTDGKLAENNQFEPDLKVKNTYKSVAEGLDFQLEAAVKELLK